MSARRIAAFDFDGTLTRRDTLLPFLVRACGSAAVARALGRAGSLTVRARTGQLDGAPHHRDATKEQLVRDLFTGRSSGWLAAQGERYAATLAARLRPEMAEQVAWHRAQGHELVIVSASLSTYLIPFARTHHFDHVIAVDLEVGDDDRLTGRLAHPNVRGPQKAERLTAWMGDDPAEVLWAYGNSSGDTELLAMADVPVWVAGRRRATTARAKGTSGRGPALEGRAIS